MKLTRADLEFWQAKKATPGWAAPVLKPKGKPQPWHRKPFDIDGCVNAHAGQKPDNSYHAHNLMTCLRGKHGQELRDYLARLIVSPGTVIAPARRSGFARKWLARVNRKPTQAKGC